MTSTVVYVAIYQTEYDTELRVFALEEQAWEWRDAIAREAWAETFDTEAPDFEIGQHYFDEVGWTNGAIGFTVSPATIDWPS